MLEGGMAEPVIGRALLRVLQHLVGFVDLLELVFAGLVAGVLVGMELHGELAEGRLQRLLVGGFADPERFIEISLHVTPSKETAMAALRPFRAEAAGFVGRHLVSACARRHRVPRGRGFF
jgi:hypothetical protein